MQKRHALYLIGGLARTGKSIIAHGIGEGRQFPITHSPYELFNPIVRNILQREIPEDIKYVAFRGTTTFWPQNFERTRPFDFSFPPSSSIVKSPAMDALLITRTDNVRSIIRVVFTGQNQGVNAIAFKGTTMFTSSGGKIIQKPFTVARQGEDPNAWNAIIGLIDDYDNSNRNDVLIEGVAITPEGVDRLKLNHLDVKAVFIGYNSESHGEALLAHLNREKENDWLYGEMKRSGKSDEAFVKDTMREWVRAGNALKQQAEALGYQYFDAAERPFGEHVQTVMEYVQAGLNYSSIVTCPTPS